MSWLRTSPAILCAALLVPACGDSSAGTGLSATGTTTAATSATGPGTTAEGSSSATGEPAPTSSGSDGGSSSTSTTASPTTGVQDTTTTTTGVPDTTGGASTSDGTTGTTGQGASTTTGGVSEPPPAPMMPAGCKVCDCCDPWPISWAAVPGATHYVVRWKCSINPEQVHDVGPVTDIADVCNDIDMCNGMCAFTVGYIKVEACNEDGCSAPVDIPAGEIPITCGGGCCC